MVPSMGGTVEGGGPGGGGGIHPTLALDIGWVCGGGSLSGTVISSGYPREPVEGLLGVARRVEKVVSNNRLGLLGQRRMGPSTIDFWP